ncbi:MAG: serine protease [Acidobacteria bacterium]|nr:serine protease [Acidobacteriota bacterium]
MGSRGRWLGAAVAVATAIAPSASSAGPRWASPGAATIHPGVQAVTPVAQCTSNFVFTRGTRVYIGMAAHCTGTEGSAATNGCESATLPEGTRVRIGGAKKLGTMVYNSWARMRAARERRPDFCAFNDLALVRIDPTDVGSVNPSVPFWGGPIGVATPIAGTVYSYGNSSLRLGIALLSPKMGESLGPTSGGWSQTVYTATPGIPGDSGSAFLDARGRAVGVLSTLMVAPLAASNGVGGLVNEIAYARAHGFAGLRLVPGDVPFSPVLPQA